MKITLTEEDRQKANAAKDADICCVCVIAQAIYRVLPDSRAVSVGGFSAMIDGNRYLLDDMGQSITMVHRDQWSDLELPIDIELR